MKTFIKIIFFSLAIAGLISCSGVKVEDDYLGSQEDERRERLGSLGGGGGLISFGGKKKTSQSRGNSGGIGINKFLWRASLDTISFMPLTSADPFGGVIITDWYEDSEAKGSRFKVNIIISSASLKSDSVKVSAFKQNFDKDLKLWSDSSLDKEVATQIENKILTRARQLKVRRQQAN